VETPPFLEAGIRSRLRQPRPEPRSRLRLNLAAASALIALWLGAGFAYQLGYFRFTKDSQESYIAMLSTRVAKLMAVGLGDHLHCAFFRKLPKEERAVELIEEKLGPKYKEVAAVVRQNVPAHYRIVLGHTCRYRGRRFIHLALTGDSRLMSLVITAKREGETFDIAGILPELTPSGVSLHVSSAQRFEIAAMETSGHLVYFVSDMPGAGNTALMQALAPELRRVLTDLEG
jgi:hypothetical protein